MSAHAHRHGTHRRIETERCSRCRRASWVLYAEPGLCFDCWQDDREARRARRREEIAAHLAAGRKVEQLGSVWPDCSPFAAQVDLAEHLESREWGFGFPTILL